MKFITALHCIIICLIPAFAATAFSAEEGTRSCSVREALKGGMYVYVRCNEKGKDIWLATVARDFKPDELVVFVDAPPMTDFYSKFLNRVFPEVIFTDLLPPTATK
jgi:hypothetical protein